MLPSPMSWPKNLRNAAAAAFVLPPERLTKRSRQGPGDVPELRLLPHYSAAVPGPFAPSHHFAGNVAIDVGGRQHRPARPRRQPRGADPGGSLIGLRQLGKTLRKP